LAQTVDNVYIAITICSIKIFKDAVTIKNVIGVVIVIIGTMIVNSEDE